jgi:hypothetical protein
VFLKEGGALVTSSKIYEYVGTGLPIVSAMESGHDARRILDGRDLWFDAAEYTPQALGEALVRAAAHVPTAGEVAGARHHALAYRRDLVLDQAIAGLEEDLGWA